MPETQISQTSFQPPTEGLGDSPFIRFWYIGQNFIAGDGVTPVIVGDGQTGFYIDHVCSIVGDRVVMPAINLWATTDGSPGTSRFIGQLYTESGSPTSYFPFGQNSGWQLPTVYGAVIAYDQLMRYNAAAYLLSAPPSYFTADQTVAEIRRIAGDFDYANVGVLGITELDTAPADPAHPIAVGINSLLLGQGFYFLSRYDSLTDAVTDIGSDQATLLIDSIASVSANLTVPSNITLFFTNEGGIQPANGVTVLIQGAIEAPPIKIFYNATSGLGTIALAAGANYLDTMNIVQKDLWAEWWGATGNNENGSAAENADALDAAFRALPHGGTLHLAGRFYKIDRGVVWDHKFQATVIGNDSYAGYSDNSTKPILVYQGANGGVALTLSNVYACTFRGFGVYSNDGVVLANGADKGIYLTYTAGGYPSLTSRCILDAITIWAVNTRDTHRCLEINDLAGANNEHHTVKECYMLGGGDATTQGRGYGIYQGHSQVKAIEYIRNNIGNCGTGILVSGSIRCIDNSFTSCYQVYHFSYLIDANFIFGDDIETITQYIETEQHPGASTCVFMANRVEAIKAVGDTADDFIVKTVGKFSFSDTGFLNGDIYNIRNFGPYAFIGDGASDVLFSNCSLQLGQSTFTNASVGQATMVCTVIEGNKVYRYGGSASNVGERTAETTPALASPRKTLNLAGSTAQAVAPMYLADGELQFWGIHAVPYFTLEVVGVTGATIRRFALVGADSIGRESFTSRPNGEFFVGVSNANATLSGSNYIKFTWPRQFPVPTNWIIYEVNPANSFEWRSAATVADAGSGLYQTYNLTANPAGSFVTRPFLNQSAQLALNTQLYFPNERTFTSLDATPSVGIGNDFVTANAGATTITDFDDETGGQEIRVRINDANTTIQNNVNIVTGTGADITAVNGAVYKFVYRAPAWRRIL